MAIPIDQVLRERRFLAAHSEWNITSLNRGSRFVATREEADESHTVVCLSLRELLDKLEKIVGDDQ